MSQNIELLPLLPSRNFRLLAPQASKSRHRVLKKHTKDAPVVHSERASPSFFVSDRCLFVPARGRKFFYTWFYVSTLDTRTLHNITDTTYVRDADTTSFEVVCCLSSSQTDDD